MLGSLRLFICLYILPFFGNTQRSVWLAEKESIWQGHMRQ